MVESVVRGGQAGTARRIAMPCASTRPHHPCPGATVTWLPQKRKRDRVCSAPRKGVALFTAVQAVNDSRGNTSVSPDLRTCCACRAYQHACDGLAFKFTGHVVDSELPSPNPRRLILNSIVSKSTGRKVTVVCFLCASVIVTLRCSRRHRLRCRVRFRMRLLAARGVQLTNIFFC